MEDAQIRGCLLIAGGREQVDGAQVILRLSEDTKGQCAARPWMGAAGDHVSLGRVTLKEKQRQTLHYWLA